ncbi:unnamed protein product, partial [marine sediment metagenome]
QYLYLNIKSKFSFKITFSLDWIKLDGIKKLEKIVNDVISQKLSKKAGIDLIVSILENSDEIYLRVKSIDGLRAIYANEKELFKLLENYLISDENENVRAAAAKTIIYIFPDEGYNALKGEKVVNEVIFKNIKI